MGGVNDLQNQRADLCCGVTAESAGLRVPLAGMDENGLPHWLCHGALFQGLRPDRSGVGPLAMEHRKARVTCFTGPSAVERLHELQKVRGAEQPVLSSEELLIAPIISPGRLQPLLRAPVCIR